MFPISKERGNYSKPPKEDGYFSLSNTSRTNISAEIPYTSYTPDGYHKTFHSSIGRASFGMTSSPLPFQSAFESTSNNSDNRGILIDRIKIAQSTIDSLSAKVFCYENEREQLHEQKEAYEKSYHRLAQENSQIRAEQIAKEALLKKINTMGDEVTELLQAQEVLLEKHKQQQSNIDYYKTQNSLLEEESKTLQRVNDQLTKTAKINGMLVEETRKREEDVKNQLVVLKIEKDAQSSEIERITFKIQKVTEKYKQQKEKETSWIRELALFEERVATHKKELTSANENIERLQRQLELSNLERQKVLQSTKSDIDSANSEIKTLQETLTLCQRDLQAERNKGVDLETSTRSLTRDVQQWKDKLTTVEKGKQQLVDEKYECESKLCKLQEQYNATQRENKLCNQKLRNAENEVVSLEKSLKSAQGKLQKQNMESEQRIEKLNMKINEIQEVYLEQEQTLQNQHSVQISKLEADNYKSQELIADLENELNLLNEKYTDMNDDYLLYREEQNKQTEYQANEISTYKSKQLKIQKKLSETKAENKQLTDDAVTLTSTIDMLRVENDFLKQRTSEKDTILEEQASTIQQLTLDCSTLESANKENRDLIEVLNKQSNNEMLSERASYESKITSLKTDVESLTIALKNAQHEQKLSSTTFFGKLKDVQNESDAQIEAISNEKDEVATQLQNALLDLTEYKNKFTSLQNELDDVSSVNADLKKNLSLLSDELQCYQQDVAQSTDKDQQIIQLQASLHEFETELSHLKIANDKYKRSEENATQETIRVQKELLGLKTSFDLQRNELENERKSFSSKEANLIKEQRESLIRIEKLKSECRKRAMQSHAKCGELEVLRAENSSIKKELEVITELNNKLEEVHHSLEDEKRSLQVTVGQSQEDMHTLKTSYEDLLAKELTKQRSEYLVKENQLLKRLSSDNLSVISVQPSPVQT